MFDEPPTWSGEIRERYEYDVYGGCIVHTDAGQDGQWMTTDTESGAGNPYMFTGRRYDPESGLYYYRARYYSPEIGRFLAPDPIGYVAGLNLYTYVNNNSVNRKDPLGLFYGPVETELMCGLIDALGPCKVWSRPMYELLGYATAGDCADYVVSMAWGSGVLQIGAGAGALGTDLLLGGSVPVCGSGLLSGTALQWAAALTWCSSRECLAYENE